MDKDKDEDAKDMAICASRAKDGLDKDKVHQGRE